jgi:hypothetical protein
MSTQPVTAATAAPSPVLTAGVFSAVRIRIVQVMLTTGSLAVIGFLLVRPGAERADRSYAAVSAGRDAAWTGHLIERLGYGLAGFGLALATCVIVRHRGAVWANVGAVMVALGGVLFAAVGYAIGVLDWYVTATDAVPTPSGTALLTYVENNPARLAGADVAGFLLLTLGSLLISVALWRSGVVPKALPAVIAALTLAQFVLPQNGVMDVGQALLMASFVAVAAFVGRTVQYPEPRTSDNQAGQ